MNIKRINSGSDDPQTVALRVLAWTIGEPDRAQRLLGMTGLDPRELRDGLEDDAMLAALIGFISAYEADLLACSEAIGVSPQAIVAAAAALDRTTSGDMSV